MTCKNKKISGGGLHHIAIATRNFDASYKFYTEGLGFEVNFAWEEGNHRAVMLDTGDGSNIEIFEYGPDAPGIKGTLIHIAFKTDDCDQAIEHARNAGAEVTSEAQDYEVKSNPPILVREAFCKGFDGEVIEFFQYKGRI